MRTCTRCEDSKSLDEYVVGSPWCADCRRAYRAGRRDHQRALERAARYGASPELQRALFEAQGGRCAACEDPITVSAPLDHDHATGAIRGYLCDACNITLGMARESANRLQGLVRYLTEHWNLTPDAVARDRERCRNDHEWTPETTYLHPSGKRHCVLCRRESDRRRSLKAAS